LSHEFIDFIAIGEGEETLLELIENKPHPDILGLGFKSGGISKINPKRPFIENLDLLPFPDRTLQGDVLLPAHFVHQRKYGVKKHVLDLLTMFLKR
jgi:radical SAM superfamily enzyme YgiQ (UPF0313 family)